MSKVEKNWLEWLVFAISLVLVAGTLGVLAYDGATMGDAPPSVEVKVGAPQERPHNFIVPVEVTNHGDETAEGVLVEVVLKQGEEERERSEFEIAFLPRRSTRQGWVAFKIDPRSVERMEARVLGYEKP
ncbi:MAG: hypothetical protein H0V27_10525 [Pyrinomonadaceae bacterium]|nr:hypothetical protein [Pyrinomonadaceae bacterium]